MKNELFKAKVAALLRDPRTVAAPHVNRGLALEKGISDAAIGGDRLLHGAGSLVERVLGGGSSPNGLLSRGVSGLGSLAMAHPVASLGLAGGTAILPQAFEQAQRKEENALQHAYRSPMEAIASLDEFLEQKAAAFGGGGAGGPTFGSSLRGGIGNALGATIVGLLAQTIGSHLSNTKSLVADDPKRHALLDTLFKSDPVLKDALARHADSKTMLLEAYGTMTRFAPALSLDINAVRSFLREAVLGGSGVNYATIKNLVDTEKSISEAKPRYGGKGHG